MDRDVMRETVYIPRGWRWEPFTIYQLRSQHAGWDSLRAILEEGSIYQLVGATSRAEEGIAAVSTLHPEGILFGDEWPDRSACGLSAELREVSPASKLVVLVEEQETVFVGTPGELGVDGVLPWRRATPLGVFCCLMPVLQDGWKVGTAGAVSEPVSQPGHERPMRGGEIVGGALAEEGRTVPEHRRQARDEDVVLTYREREVLRAVAAGLENAQIARQLEVSERTARRVITELEQKLVVANRAALAARAVELGLGS
jgi:DNA-binding NarL/FixJ family response regulator